MTQWLATLLIALGLILTQHSVVSAEEAASWVDRLTFSGDVRLRHESFMKDHDTDRTRQRFRLRLRSDIVVKDFTVGIRLASGVGEQVSTNQSFDNLFSGKDIVFDQAFLRWTGMKEVMLIGGRMPNPFFTISTTDLIWDEDLNPEGVAEKFTRSLSDRTSLFVTLGQFILDEDSEDSNDQWLFGFQVGGEYRPTKTTGTTVSFSYYNLTNTRDGTFGQKAIQEGNTRLSNTNATLRNDFDILSITGEVATTLGPLPFSLLGDYAKNIAEGITGQDTGFQVGVRLGKARDPWTWEIAYFYKYLETDATVADLADSDFGDGGTNRKGHIVWGALAPTQFLQFKVKFFSTQVENETLPPGPDDIDRLQVDLSLRF